MLVEADWSVGGIVTHQSHKHHRINRYQAIYTLAMASTDGEAPALHIVDTRVRNAERVSTPLESSGGASFPLDELPKSERGYLGPAELLDRGSSISSAGRRTSIGLPLTAVDSRACARATQQRTRRIDRPRVEIGLRSLIRRPHGGEDAFQLELDDWTARARRARGAPWSLRLRQVDAARPPGRSAAPEPGSIVVEGADVTTPLRRRGARAPHPPLGFVFQDFPLVDYLDAIENVLLPYRLNPALRSTTRRASAGATCSPGSASEGR